MKIDDKIIIEAGGATCTMCALSNNPGQVIASDDGDTVVGRGLIKQERK